LGSKYTLITSSETKPEQSEGTTVFARGNTITTEGSFPFVRKQVNHTTTIQEFMVQQPQWGWLQPSFLFPADGGKSLAEAIRERVHVLQYPMAPLKRLEAQPHWLSKVAIAGFVCVAMS
jgi:hypothetical protein